MGRIVEKSGKNVNEAISAALAELGLTVDDVHVDVLDEGKAGLFGLLSGKQAKVRVSELEEFERVPQPGFTGAQQEAPGEGPADTAEDDDEAEDAAGDEPYADEGPGDAAGEDDEAEEQDDDGDLQYEYSGDINKAIDFISRIFDGIHVEAGITAETNEEGFTLNIESDDSGILIGHRGETLDSIQYLLNLYMNKGRGAFVRVNVDVENYKMKREAALIRLAGQMADKVVRLRRNFTLDAMNSYERRIVHSALQNHPKVETYSIGEDPNRKVVVTLKNRGSYSAR